jgi:hypothetical protein
MRTSMFSTTLYAICKKKNRTKLAAWIEALILKQKEMI